MPLFNQAIEAQKNGQFKEAENLYRNIIAKDSRNFDALHMLGIVCSENGKILEAEQFFRSAISIDPNFPPCYHNYGLFLAKQERYQESIQQFDNALRLFKNYAPAYCDRGISLMELGRLDESLVSHNNAAALAPNVPIVFYNRANTFFKKRSYSAALQDYDKAIALSADYADAYCGRGNIFTELKRFNEALAAYDKALALKPDLAKAWYGRGSVFRELKRFDEAFAAYDKALALKPDLAEVWIGRGHIYRDLKRFDEAFAAYDKALAQKPDLAEACYGRGNVLTELKRFDEAFAAYDKTLALRPSLAEAWNGRGNVFRELKRFDEAFAAYDKALALKPDLAEAWYGRGNVLTELKRFDEAFAAYDKTLALKPDLAEAWNGRGNVFTELKRFDEAFAAYDKAFTIKPDIKCLEGSRLNAKLQICDWTNLPAEVSHLLIEIRQQKPASAPFQLLSIPSSPTDHLKCAQMYATDVSAPEKLWRGERYTHDRIRVAYVSADFRDHAVSHLLADLFEHHDRARFETTAIALGADNRSEMRIRLERAFERFIDVQDKSDLDVSRLMRDLEVDIVIDLMGFTFGCRPAILAYRSAPIQVNYLSYPGIVGTDYIDYILADRFVIPEGHRELFHEAVVYLPDAYLGYDAKRKIAERIPTRAELGLPETGFVFCAYNNSYKITPQMFDIWMRLLREIPGSVLWLSGTNTAAMGNLRREALARGVDPSRLCFALYVNSVADHLARYRLADLFLDALPFNAQTTACDALWAGLPVLTCLGSTFVGRVAASLLNAVGLQEMVTTNLETYEALALKLVREPALLAGVKTKLAQNLRTYPLFDSKRFARHIEAAYTTMWERYQRGEPPTSFAVEPIH